MLSFVVLFYFCPWYRLLTHLAQYYSSLAVKFVSEKDIFTNVPLTRVESKYELNDNHAVTETHQLLQNLVRLGASILIGSLRLLPERF